MTNYISQHVRHRRRRFIAVGLAAMLAVAASLPASAGSVPLNAGGCLGTGGTSQAQPTGLAYTTTAGSCPTGWRWIHAHFYDSLGMLLDDYDPGGRNNGDWVFFGSSTATDLISAGHSICHPSGSPCHLDHTQD